MWRCAWEFRCVTAVRGFATREKVDEICVPTDLSGHPDLVEVAMQPGDIVMFRPTTVHWSGPNHDGSERRGFNCFYTGDPFKHLSKEDWAALKEQKRKAGQ